MEPPLKAGINNRKNLLNSDIFSTCPHNIMNFSPLAAEKPEIGLPVWGTPAIFNGFRVNWLRYCTDVAQRKSTKLCTMFGCLLPWYTRYTFSGALAP